MRYVIDSFAWLEYFMGSRRGKAARNIIDSKSDDKFTPAICIAEVYAKSLKNEGATMAEARRNFMRDRGAVATLDEGQAVEAAKINVARKKEVREWDLADSIVPTTAKELGAKVVTGDAHFDGLPEVVMV
jgi:predicted nucleic acid-binding protein